MDWWHVKVGIAEWSRLSMDALHVHAGVLIALTVALVTRRPLSSPLPFIAVLLFALGNEWFDLAYETWPEGSGQKEESVRDLLNTLAIPLLLLVLTRAAPRLFSRPAALASQPQAEASESAGEG